MSSTDCKCVEDSKIPDELVRFVHDQRSTKSMTLTQAKRIIKDSMPSTSAAAANEIGETNNPNSDESFHPILSSESEQSPRPWQMRYKLNNLAMAVDRTGVSQRSAAIIANAVLVDIGIVTAKNIQMVIDKSKLARQLKSLHEDILKKPLHDSEMVAIYFDGRKDKTLLQEKKGHKYYRKEIHEEHVTLLEEPNSKYLGHVSPESGTGIALMNSISSFLEDLKIDLSKIAIVGCDRTRINTGVHNGAIRQMEVKLQHPLQWFICQIHANELILRHLFEHYDGRKTGPIAFSGPISKAIISCENLPIVNFEPLQSDTILPDIEPTHLSTDQQYLLEIGKAVASGRCPVDLANKKPGPISHSRWLTTANRLLRLYIATSTPSKKLKNLAILIIKVYVPLWFAIKKQPECIMGPHHLYLTISLSRSLDSEIKKIIDPVIQRNGFFAHPENLLLAMITDADLEIRIEALQRILECRKSAGQELRLFKVPEINFDAREYKELIKWEEVSEPPVLKELSTEKLSKLIISETYKLKEMLRFPCHTQAVERHVKLVTEASKSVCGYKARHAQIVSKLQSRHLMPVFESKKDFVVSDNTD